MSRKFPSTKNKQQKHPTVFFEQYLISPNEPMAGNDADSASIEAELLGDRQHMRQRIRRMAKRARSRYS